MVAPIQKVPTFRPVKNIFLELLVYLPLFMYSQNTPLSPYVNQLAKSALIRLRRSLKTGIASARIHATIQRVSTISAHTPKLPQVLLLIRSVPRNRRT